MPTPTPKTKSSIPPLGHNRPPKDALTADLTDRNHDLALRQSRLLDLVKRQPKTAKDADDVKELGGVIRELREFNETLDAAHKEQKRPYLDAGRAVDGYFKGLAEPINAAMAVLNRIITVWQDRIEAERRRKAEEEAEQARLEAERLAKIAAKKRATEEQQLAAAAAEEEAETAEAVATAAPADLVRVRDEEGTITRKVEIICAAINRETLDLEALRQHLPEAALFQAVRSFIRAGGRELAGAEIIEQKTAIVL